jgi:hypothetical protein
MAIDKPRVPATLKPSQSRRLKTKYVKSGSNLSFKGWLSKQTDDVTASERADWLHNKRANTSKPPQRIGRTRTRVKKGGGGKDKDLTGK